MGRTYVGSLTFTKGPGTISPPPPPDIYHLILTIPTPTIIVQTTFRTIGVKNIVHF